MFMFWLISLGKGILYSPRYGLDSSTTGLAKDKIDIKQPEKVYMLLKKETNPVLWSQEYLLNN